MKKFIFLLLILWMGVKSLQAQHEMSIAPFDTTVWNSNRSVYNLIPDSFPVYFKQTSGVLIDHFKWEIFGFSRVDTLVEYQEERPIFWVKYKKPISGFGQSYVSIRITTTDILLEKRMYQLNLNIYFYKVNILNADTISLKKGDSVLIQAKGTWGIGQMSWYQGNTFLVGPVYDSTLSYFAKTPGKYYVRYAKGFQNSPIMIDSVLVLQEVSPNILFEQEKNNILVYPNPAKDKLFFSSDVLLEDVSIFNLIGEKVLKTDQLEIDVSSLSKGIYIVTCTTSDNKVLNKKIIIE